jgi:hypothetical protein
MANSVPVLSPVLSAWDEIPRPFDRIGSSEYFSAEQAALGWATISYKVAVLAQCPVLLVK